MRIISWHHDRNRKVRSDARIAWFSRHAEGSRWNFWRIAVTRFVIFEADMSAASRGLGPLTFSRLHVVALVSAWQVAEAGLALPLTSDLVREAAHSNFSGVPAIRAHCVCAAAWAFATVGSGSDWKCNVTWTSICSEQALFDAIG